MNYWDKISNCAYQKKYGKAYREKKRFSKQYTLWRRLVLLRDGKKCIFCNSSEKIKAHHIRRWIDNPILRFKVSNGATLCEKCHNSGHGGNGKEFNPGITFQIEQIVSCSKSTKGGDSVANLRSMVEPEAVKEYSVDGESEEG